MPINSRQKGARYEREVAHFLSDHGFESRRGQQFSGGKDSPDVVSPDFPLHIEAKFVERLDLYGAMTQSIRDAGEKPPCVVHRKKNSESLITLRLSDFIQIITQNNNNE